MAAKNSTLHIRLDDDTKVHATETLASMGLSVSEAVRLFLRRVVVERAFPLELKVPNAETEGAMLAARTLMAARQHRAERSESRFDVFDKDV